jgi:pyridoxamine 5'-phosphate oxidase
LSPERGVDERRAAYQAAGLDARDVSADPIEQFGRWYADVLDAALHEPEAVVLSTVDAAGRPSSRYVLCKLVDERGFTFHTNYTSRKGADLEATGVGSLLFPWHWLGRQVRVEGAVGRVSPAESDLYFATRARGSQVGAWASEQSSPLADRAELERRVAEVEARFEGRAIPRPPHWGGFRLVPEVVELWQGRADRLHDRLRYTRDGAGWRLTRLSP